MTLLFQAHPQQLHWQGEHSSSTSTATSLQHSLVWGLRMLKLKKALAYVSPCLTLLHHLPTAPHRRCHWRSRLDCRWDGRGSRCQQRKQHHEWRRCSSYAPSRENAVNTGCTHHQPQLQERKKSPLRRCLKPAWP